MMTLGRNSRLILDSWTRPTYARIAGKRRVPTDAAIERRFRGYGADAGLAFWLFVTRDWVPEILGLFPGLTPPYCPRSVAGLRDATRGR